MTEIRLVTIDNPDHEVVLFTLPGGGGEAVITSPHAPRKPTTVVIPPPPEGSRIVMTRFSDGRVEITYRKM